MNNAICAVHSGGFIDCRLVVLLIVVNKSLWLFDYSEHVHLKLLILLEISEL